MANNKKFDYLEYIQPKIVFDEETREVLVVTGMKGRLFEGVFGPFKIFFVTKEEASGSPLVSFPGYFHRFFDVIPRLGVNVLRAFLFNFSNTVWPSRNVGIFCCRQLFVVGNYLLQFVVLNLRLWGDVVGFITLMKNQRLFYLIRPVFWSRTNSVWRLVSSAEIYASWSYYVFIQVQFLAVFFFHQCGGEDFCVHLTLVVVVPWCGRPQLIDNQPVLPRSVLHVSLKIPGWVIFKSEFPCIVLCTHHLCPGQIGRGGRKSNISWVRFPEIARWCF